MKAIIDTTILTDILLKLDSQRCTARRALDAYESTLLPQYAIKEFKAGPLRYYVWFHAKVVQAPTWAEALAAIPSVLPHQRNRASTALQALKDFQSSIGRKFTDEINKKYPNTEIDSVMKDEASIWLLQKITRAWRKRNSVTTEVINILPCYAEKDLVLKGSGLIDDSPRRCGVSDCCLRERYRDRLEDLELLEAACDNSKREVAKRKQALRQLRRHPNTPLAEKDCISLGDAVLVLDCPKDGTILTTNVSDHEPLAKELGLSVNSTKLD